MGLSGRVPPRVEAATKAGLLDLVEQAVAAGWEFRAACRVLELGTVRAYRWLGRRAADELEDRRPGGSPLHGLLDWEVAEVVALFHRWGEVDRSHRKLAHRGSYLERVWVSPSSVRRVLAAEGLRLRPLPRPGRSVRKPFPDWVEYTPNSIWIFDTTHFTRAGVAATVIEDLVSRKWLPRDRLRRGDLHPGPGRVHRRAGTRRSAGAGYRPPGWPGRPQPRRPVPADPAGDERQRPADDLGLHPRVHGLVRDPPALRPPRHPDRPGLDLGRCSATSRPNGPTWPRSATRRPCAPSSRWSASSTTRCGCTPGSAT